MENEKIHFAWRVQNLFVLFPQGLSQSINQSISLSQRPTHNPQCTHKYLLLHRALKQVTVSFTDESRLVYKFQACKPPKTLEKIKGKQHKGQTSDLYCI